MTIKNHFSVHYVNGKYYAYIVTVKDGKVSINVERLG